MSGLLKGDAIGSRPIMPFGMNPRAPAAAEPDRQELLEARIEELEAMLAAREEQHQEALAAARAEAAEQALQERSTSEEAKLAALQRTLDDAAKDWRSRLASWTGPAAGIAAAVLGKLFDETATGPLAPLIESIVRQRLAALGDQSLVTVRVSPADFPDEAVLAGLEAAVGARHARLAADPALAAGECVMDLKLGHIDLSIGEQWRRIEALLAAIEADGGCA